MDFKKIKIGIFVSSNIDVGGGFQYESKITTIFSNYDNTYYEFDFFTTNENIVSDYLSLDINIKFIPIQDFEKTLITLHNVKVIYFLGPSQLIDKIRHLPYIVTIWDLCHRDFSEFPEVRLNGVFEAREKYYESVAIKKAMAIIVESELGAQNLARRYGVDSSRIHNLKMPPRIDQYDDCEINIKHKYNIDNEYIFYPAQFWPHKNHIYILEALWYLKSQHGVILNSVFCGKDYGNLDYILTAAKKMGIDQQVHYIGFVDNREIPSLYRQALAMVMPTYFGPTNIPPIEAFRYGVPVCYSDLPGMREQVCDAAFLIDLNSYEDLASKLIKILNKDAEVFEKIEKGISYSLQYNDLEFITKIISILDNYRRIRACWGDDNYSYKIESGNFSQENFFVYAKYQKKIIDLAKLLKESNKKYVVYGAGVVGVTLKEFLGDSFLTFIDDNLLELQDYDSNSEACPPSKLPSLEYDMIIIASLSHSGVMRKKLLDSYNIRESSIVEVVKYLEADSVEE